MPSSATIVPFPRTRFRKPRPAKARLTTDVRAALRCLSAIMPAMGIQNPRAVWSVVRYAHCLVPKPPPLDGLEIDGSDTVATIAPPETTGEEFDRARRRDMVACQQTGSRLCAAWLAAHPHRAVSR